MAWCGSPPALPHILILCLAVPQVKGVALGIVEGLSGSADGIAQLKAVQPPLVRKLFGLAADKPEVSRKALGALVNLSQDAAVAEALLKLGAINRVMDYIRDGTSPHADLLVGAAAGRLGRRWRRRACIHRLAWHGSSVCIPAAVPRQAARTRAGIVVRPICSSN